MITYTAKPKAQTDLPRIDKAYYLTEFLQLMDNSVVRMKPGVSLITTKTNGDPELILGASVSDSFVMSQSNTNFLVRFEDGSYAVATPNDLEVYVIKTGQALHSLEAEE